MSRFLGMKEPEDIMPMEKKIINYAYANIYGLISDPLDKFIVVFMFDLGHGLDVTSVATGLSRTSIWRRRNKIKALLKGVRLNNSMFDNIE